MALLQIVPGRVVRLKFHPYIAVKDKYKGKSTVDFLPDTTRVFYQYNKRFNFSPIFKVKFKIDTKCLVGNSLIYSEDIKISADMSALTAQENFCRNIKRNIDIIWINLITIFQLGLRAHLVRFYFVEVSY